MVSLNLILLHHNELSTTELKYVVVFYANIACQYTRCT
jgi:hypothetical protein